MNKEYSHGSAIPSSRTSRVANLFSLASSLAGGVLAEGASQLSQGNRPEFKDLLLTPANAQRLADKLMKLRGAALKVGQLLSMDAGEFVPRELSEILAKLRDDVEPMPFSQLIQCLENQWGEDWGDKFKQFSYTPIAAASIGQVHSAHTIPGEKLALKIQYPGVEKSIDSDVDNVASLLRVTGLIPKQQSFDDLFTETKQQLRIETDYLTEANRMMQYKEALADNPDFIVPKVDESLTTKTILAMSYHEGIKVDSITHLPQEEKNKVASLLIDLMLNEMFNMHCVQTDPNMANYLYDESSKKIILLDFGAVRELPIHFSHAYYDLMQASISNNKSAINQACENIGFFQESITNEQRETVIDLFLMACEPLRQVEGYDFGQSNLATRISNNALKLSAKKQEWHTPPVDALFLHRKIAGMYLVAAKLSAKVHVSELFAKYSK